MKKLFLIFLFLLLLSPHYLIAEEKDITEEEALNTFSDFEADYQKSKTPLIIAVENGNMSQAKTLLDKGANPDASDLLGTTPLMIASAKGYVDIVILLLQSGAYVDAADKNGITPLMCAVSHPNIVKVLLQNGATVSSENSMGETALDRAKNVLYGTPNDETIQLLQKAQEEENKELEEWDKILEDALGE